MATSKTLTPTNQTISIPELTDAPDISVPADAIDKEADAINTLNSNTIKKSATSLGTYGYASEVVRAIKNSILSLLNNGESMLCSFVTNADRDYWHNGQTYIGVVSKKDGNAYSGIFTSGKGDSFTCGTDDNASTSTATGTKNFVLKSEIVSLADAGTQNNYNADFGTSSKIAPAVFPSNSSNTPWSAANTAGYVVKFGRTYGRDIAISQEGIKTRSVLNGSVGAWDDILFSRAHITSVELAANGSKSLTFNAYGMCLTATSRDASSYDTLAFVTKGGVHSIITASVVTYSMSNSILTITNTTSWPVRLVVVDLNHYLSPVTIS